MCGIIAASGFYNRPHIFKLVRKLKHRGPDAVEVKVLKNGTLAHTRLSIIDIKAGQQPIKGTRNSYLVHNGEIYNYKNIYKKFLDESLIPKSTSDSEVIIHLYEKFGFDFCNLLDGDFAFVIFDEDKAQVMAARDPMGVKPLYYGYDFLEKIWFASEMKALQEDCREVFVFPPGHYYSPETGFVKYYYPEWEYNSPEIVSKGLIRERLSDAVIKRMMSDVPFGVLLSGGLDSSLVASIMKRQCDVLGIPLHSFSIGLNKDAPDLIKARRAAEFLGTVHHEFYFTIDEGIQNIENLVQHLESYDVTTVRASTPMYFLSKKISELGFKMVLSGEGADEIFGGYLYFFNAPDELSFHEETKRRVRLLHTADVLRADKSTMAAGLEVRVPFLDRKFLDASLLVKPSLRRPQRQSGLTPERIEKQFLRESFDDIRNCYLPDEILWRKKEQFSDGVGYAWINALKEYCEKNVSDEEMKNAYDLFPFNTPETKEAFYIRKIFEKYFHANGSVQTVLPWVPKWQKSTDPSGRASEHHGETIAISLESV
jgi:asparagine synthase (glutamine-hydrolysing)